MANKRWRSALFSALGAGFQDDDTLHDGIHLRWSSDPTLGLPWRLGGQPNGVFRVTYLNPEWPCLSDLELCENASEWVVPIYSTTDTSGDSVLDPAHELGTRFLKRTDLDFTEPFFQFANLATWLEGQDLTPEQTHFLDYMERVMERLQPEVYAPNWHYTVEEVCAVDVYYDVPKGPNAKYAIVQALDRHGNVLGEDWLGRNKFGNTKTSVYFRSPHIYAFRHQPIRGMPPVSPQQVCWMFCDDYCDADIWSPERLERQFNADPGDYTPQALTDDYYAPFTKQLDWDEAAALLHDNLIDTPFMQELLAQGNTYDTHRFSAPLEPEDGPDPQNNPNLDIPILPALIQAATDPALANILGLYGWDKNFPPSRDYRIEAYVPFVHPDNLVKLSDLLNALTFEYNFPGPPVDLERLSGLPPGSGHSGLFERSTALCGLVLCTDFAKRPAPPRPTPITTLVRSTDLPVQPPGQGVELYVSDRLRFPRPPFTTVPYLQPVAYEIERKFSGTGYGNVIDLEEQPDPLDEIGILPSVHFPKPFASNLFEVRDDFRLSNLQEETVQYRLTAFDIFGRPSDPGEGTEEPIPIPCYAPISPTSLSGQVMRDGSDLNLELYFAVTDVVPPLHAVPDTLEITLHAVEATATEAAEDVKWIGDRLGRTFTIDYHPDGAFLDPTQFTTGCSQLSWSGDQLIRTTVPPGDCQTEFPFDPATLVFDTASTPLNDEAVTGFRMYRLFTQIGDTQQMTPDQYRWCVRLRVRGTCESGQTLHSNDLCVAAQFNLPEPPPVVQQPPLVAIPESTYSDTRGDAYYPLDLSSFLGPPAGPKRVNLYSVVLSQLTETPEDIVDGDFFAPNGDVNIIALGRAGRRHFQRLNDAPILYTADTRFHPIHVRGDLEEYHVVGVIGTNAQLEEKDWRQAGILLFKTPRPVPAPDFRFVSASPVRVGDAYEISLDYRADFASEVPAGTPLPKVQVMRHDLSSGQKRLVGESDGVWTGDAYAFTVTDAHTHDWRRYRYEATLLLHADKLGQSVRSAQRATCELIVPETGTRSPFIAGLGPQIGITNGTDARFSFTAGDFNVSLTKTRDDDTVVRMRGSLYSGELRGLPDATLRIDRKTGIYELAYHDDDHDARAYTLRLWQGQKPAWSQHINTTES